LTLKKDLLKNLVLWAIIALILIMVFNSFGPRKEPHTKLIYSHFLKQVQQGKVAAVTITNQDVIGKYKDNKTFQTYIPQDHVHLLTELDKATVAVTIKPPAKRSFLLQLLISWFPILLIVGIWIYILRQQTGGGRGGAMSFGRSRARLLNEGQVKVTFADVAGCEEAKEEVKELVDFLKDPAKFQKLGGKVPRGALLVGSPGTGKTLLAKAVAGEAKVPFFSISGSDFVEMFVGVGASRVRDMFTQAKKQAPCIIFIDELDAVGRHRGAGLGGGHDEREQTLNQLLVELDGFEGKEGVIVLATTNRPDVLDPALLRPGRFDRQVVVPLPDIRGREQILKVHMKKIPTDEKVNLAVIARGTPGFSGADLANLANEAALIAARQNMHKVNMDSLEKAKDKIMMGAERRTMVMSEDEKKLTAYHEAGHAVVGRLMPEHDPVYKVSIIPRGRALGITMFLPEQDRYSITKLRLNSQITALYGGRVAEELTFGSDRITTGAANDIKRATKLTRNMVMQWGLSDKLGPLTYGEEQGEVFLGQSLVTKHKEISDHTAEAIDIEVRNIVDRNYKHAEELLKKNRKILDMMAEALLKYETLDSDQIDDIMQGKPARVPSDWIEEESEKPKKEPPVQKTEKTVKEKSPAKTKKTTSKKDTE
jgi:cell division protease FtsH